MSRSSTCTFTNSRGHRLSARLERPETDPPRATALFAHCFTCSKDLKAARRIARAMTDRGLAVLSFDFTGLGRSEGDFAGSTFSSDVDDLLAAAGYLREELEPPRLLVGHSLGGAAVLRAAHRLPEVRAVATIGAPADPSHLEHLFADDLETIRQRGEADVTIAGRTFRVTKTFLDDLGEHQLEAELSELDKALLFFHAPQDKVVGLENARLLYEAARHPKSFVSLDGADHLLTDEADARYVAEVTAAWAARYLPSAGGEQESGSQEAESSYDDELVTARNDGGLATAVSVRGFALRVDEPDSVGGTETGPTPYDYLGAALAACTSMTVRMYADRKELPLEHVTTTVTHDRVHAEDCAHCEHTDGRIELLRRTLSFAGELSESERERLLEIASRCPVHRTLEGQLEVHTTLEEGS